MSFKKVVSLLLVACLFATIGLFFVSCEIIEVTETDTNNKTAETTANTVAETTANNTPNKDNKLGNYIVEIKSYRLAEDYQGEPIVIVKYGFTNNDNDASAFYLSLSDHVYQNGIGLNECYFVDDSANYSSDNQTKEIKQGASIDVEVAYKLNDTTSDIEIEVSELISFSSKKVTKTFKISSETNTGNSTVETTVVNTSNENKLGDYSVEIKSCRLAEDYLGDPIVIVKYVFTNNDDNDPAAFYIALEDHVYQNGVGLNECYVADDSANYSSDNQTKEIKKGASIEVEVAYKLNDTTSDIEVEVSEWISFSSKKVTKTFKIAS